MNDPQDKENDNNMMIEKFTDKCLEGSTLPGFVGLNGALLTKTTSLTSSRTLDWNCLRHYFRLLFFNSRVYCWLPLWPVDGW